MYHVPVGKMRSYKSVWNIVDLFKIPLGIIKAFWIIRRFRPDVIFAKGGYVSLPTVVAGWLAKVPVVMHDSDSVPGRTNLYLARFANKVGVNFAEIVGKYPPDKAVYTGLPIRPEFKKASVARAKKFLKYQGSKPILLVTGASSGAHNINKMVLPILPQLLKEYFVVWQCGERNVEEMEIAISPSLQGRGTRTENLRVYGFINQEMSDVMKAADLIVSRASATNVAEAFYLKKPCFLIPLPWAAQNHQVENARLWAKKGLVRYKEERSLTPEKLLVEIEKTWKERKKLVKNIGGLEVLDGTKRVAAMIRGAAGRY